MNMRVGYFEALIGSVTLDIYNPKPGGLMLFVDSTQGYHEKVLHLATKYPGIISSKSNVFSLLPSNVWLATGASITMLAIIIMIIILTYAEISSSLLRPNLDPVQVLMRLFAGFTEPDNENWFIDFSTGFALS